MPPISDKVQQFWYSARFDDGSFGVLLLARAIQQYHPTLTSSGDDTVGDPSDWSTPPAEFRQVLRCLSAMGLLKGGSKRRVTPLTDISHPIPENAVQKTVVLHGVPGKEKEYLQAWSVNQEPLCKLCQKPCNGILAKTPEFLEDLFCNLGCYNEYRFRTSQRSLRDALFQIEYGVCSLCKLDCHKLVKSIKPLSIERRRTYIQEVAPKLANKKNLLRKLVCEPIEGNAWHADHIVPVNNGGGECGLENMRTLCVACHSEVTKAGQAELRLRRKREKEIVRIFMKEAENGSTSEHTDSASVKEAVEISEESLFVSVPGSSYSRKQVADNQIQELEFPICLGQF